MVKLGNDWDEILSDEFEKPYYLELREFLKEEYRTKTIYPNMNNILEALNTMEKIKLMDWHFRYNQM